MTKKWHEREFPENIYPLRRTSLAGVEVAHRILEKAKREDRGVLIYIDPDTDGMISALFFTMYMEKHGLDYTWYTNPDRKHGFFLDPKDLKGRLMVNGDFQVTPQQMQDLIDNDVDVLSLDHHEMPEGEPLLHIETDRNIGIYINNQYDFEDPSMRFQSGAGVTAEVMAEVDPELFHNKLTYALVGITLLSDIRDIEAPKAREFLEMTYSIKNEGYIRHLIDGCKGVEYGFGIPKLDMNFINFKLSPKINSMLRLGLEERAVDFIMGKSQPLEDYAKTQREIVALMMKNAKILEGDNLVFAEFDLTDLMAEISITHVNPSNFVGLCCSKLIDKYGKSVIGYTKDVDGSTERASFRGRVNTADYRRPMTEVIDGRGHGVAFGIVGFKPTGKMFKRLDILAGLSEEGIEVFPRYMEVRNMAKFETSKAGMKVAQENDFLLEPNRVFLKYTGSRITTTMEREKIIIYSIDRCEVKCFDLTLDPRKDLIQPLVSKGRMELILTKRLEE